MERFLTTLRSFLDNELGRGIFYIVLGMGVVVCLMFLLFALPVVIALPLALLFMVVPPTVGLLVITRDGADTRARGR